MRQARRARSALTWGVMAFVAGQALLGYLLQTRWEAWRDPAYGHKAQRLRDRRAAAPSNSRTVAFLGSSRVAWGVRGEPIEKAFPTDEPAIVVNLGMSAAGPLQQLLTLRRLLEDGLRPDIVVLEVLPPFFAGSMGRQEIERIAPDRFRLREHDFARHWGGDSERLAELAVTSILMPAHTHRTAMLQGVQPGLVPYRLREDWYGRVDRWGGTDLPRANVTAESRQQRREVARSEYQPYLEGFPLGGSAPVALRELLELCRSEGIRPILLWMPEGPAFRSWYPSEAVVQMEQFLTELQREHNVPLIQARDWIDEDGFSDSHHLLPEAAQTFSERLAPELVRRLGHFSTNRQAESGTGR